jgi:hypothetical protein
LNQNRALIFCFDAFSKREPVPTSLENAIARYSSGWLEVVVPSLSKRKKSEEPLEKDRRKRVNGGR